MTIDRRDEFEKENDSIRRNLEPNSNESDEIVSQCAKQYGPRISISNGISISDDFEKLRINLCSTESIRKSCSATNLGFPGSVRQENRADLQNALPSMNRTAAGIRRD
jgi:hypothetical protein